MAESFRQLRLTDLQIATCTQWKAPDGTVYLELPHVISFFQRVGADAAPLFDVEVGTPPEFDFVCKVVSYTGVTPGTLLQIQWPDGRYLQANPLDFFSFIGTGMRGRLIDPHKAMRPNSKIQLNIDNSAVGSASDIELYFEGVLRVPFTAVSHV